MSRGIPRGKINSAKMADLRHRQSLTQKSLAEKTNRSIRTIENIERGAGGTTVATLQCIADVLGVKPNDLLNLAEAEEIMRTENGMRVKFVIEVRDTFSNSDVPPYWHSWTGIEDPPNPSDSALKIAQKFAKERAERMIGTRLDPDDSDDSRICTKSEWQIVKKMTTTEIVDMGSKSEIIPMEGIEEDGLE
jgi:transcriptional regulator with XRE-family HTH domain